VEARAAKRQLLRRRHVAETPFDKLAPNQLCASSNVVHLSHDLPDLGPIPSANAVQDIQLRPLHVDLEGVNTLRAGSRPVHLTASIRGSDGSARR